MTNAVGLTRKNMLYWGGLVVLSLGVVIGGVAYLTAQSLNAIHNAQDSGLARLELQPGSIDEQLHKMGKGWLISPETVASAHVQCIQKKDLPKAQRDADAYNESFHSMIYGKAAVTKCVLNDGATTADVSKAVVDFLGLDGEYAIGEIRDFDRGGFTADSYVVKSVHVMTPKVNG